MASLWAASSSWRDQSEQGDNRSPQALFTGELVTRQGPSGSELRLITQHLDRKVGAGASRPAASPQLAAPQQSPPGDPSLHQEAVLCSFCGRGRFKKKNVWGGLMIHTTARTRNNLDFRHSWVQRLKGCYQVPSFSCSQLCFLL